MPSANGTRAASTSFAAEEETTPSVPATPTPPQAAEPVDSADQLEFTVIGDAANRAARIEGQCKLLGEPELLAAAYAASLERASEVGASSVAPSPL